MPSRCTARVRRTTAHPGANGRVPASHRRFSPETNRAFASRPNTSTSTSASAIAATVRSRWSRIRFVAHVRQHLVAVVGDDDDLLRPEPGPPVVPEHGFEHEHHSRCEYDALVELVTEVGTDERHLRALGAGA